MIEAASLYYLAGGTKAAVLLHWIMPKQKKPLNRSDGTGFIVGSAAFSQISAVEGIRLKPAAKKRSAKAASKGLSADQRREMIIRVHRKG